MNFGVQPAAIALGIHLCNLRFQLHSPKIWGKHHEVQNAQMDLGIVKPSSAVQGNP